jgi:hypothetical protein
MSFSQGFGLADIVGALHYGYEATLSAEIAGTRLSKRWRSLWRITA